MAWSLALAAVGAVWVTSVVATLDGFHTQYIRFGEAAFLSLACWLILLAAVRRVWVALLLALPAAILLPVEVWQRIAMGTPTTAHSMALVVETSWGEVLNFWTTYGGAGTSIAIGAWLLLYCFAIATAYHHHLVWRHRSYIWCRMVVPATLLIMYAGVGAPDWISQQESLEPFDGKVSQGWSEQWTDVFPVNVVIAIQQYRLERVKLLGVERSLQRQTLGARLLSAEAAPEVLVLVIGESSSASHWSVFGYPRMTTPHLHKQAGLVAFSDVVALALATRIAVPGVLSRRPVLTPDGHTDAEAEPSFIKAFSEAGYHTHWISNQSPFGKFDTSIAVYAREAANVRFLNPSTFEHPGSWDSVLLDPLEGILNSPGRHLVVLHTLGSHFDYAHRYPIDFDRFTPSSKIRVDTNQSGASNHERLINDYDNSILFTDYFLSRVIAALTNRGGRSMMAYFSDHGVDLPGGPCRYYEAARSSESAYRVPVLFWASDPMRQANATDWQRLVENRDKPYTTRAMYSTLIELGQVGVDGDLPNESFTHAPDLMRVPRSIGAGRGRVNFDEARKRNACVISAKRE